MEGSLRNDFSQYDMANPIIWEMFEKYALSLIDRGVERYGSKGIIEVVRYNIKYQGKPVSVNNNFTPDYARKFIAKYPDHKNFFEFRVRRIS